MFKDFYSKIDELHNATSGGVFLQARYSLAMKELERAYSEFMENIGIAMLEFANGLSQFNKAYDSLSNNTVEVNPNLTPSREMLDAGGGEGSKRFAEIYIKALQKNE